MSAKTVSIGGSTVAHIPLNSEADAAQQRSAKRADSPHLQAQRKEADARSPRSRLETDARSRMETDGGPVIVAACTIADVEAARPAREPLLIEGAAAEPADNAQSGGRSAQAEKESTGFRSHLAAHGARLVFLFSHGLLVVLVSASLANLSQASWHVLFAPVWIGNSMCIALLIWSVFASCPYIKRATKARRVRLGPYPSLITELVPGIFLNILGALLMLIVTAGEWTLYKYLSTAVARRLIEAAVFLSIVCLLAICRGVLLIHNSSPLVLSMAASVLLALYIFIGVRNGEPEEKAWVLAPFVISVFVVLSHTFDRCRRHSKFMGCEEKLLRLLEIVALLACLFALASMTLKVRSDELGEAGIEGMIAGFSMGIIALLRARLVYWELRSGTLDTRVIEDMAVPGEGVYEEFDEDQEAEMQTLDRQHAAEPQEPPGEAPSQMAEAPLAPVPGQQGFPQPRGEQ